MDQDSWVKDGSVEATPVTTSTPEATVVETPAADTGAAAAIPSIPAAGSAGEAAAKATADAAASGATPAQAAAAGQAAAEEFIEGKYQDKPFKIPAGVQLPWKRGNESGFASIADLQKSGMLERDYRIKTAQFAEERRAALVEQRRIEARLQAQAQWLEDQQNRQTKAFASPEEQAQYDAFLTQYRRDPAFKKMVDDSREAAAVLAEQGAVQEVEQHETLVDTTAQVLQTIHTLGEQYPGVDPDAIRQRYSQALVAGTLPLSHEAIKSLYEQEAQAISRITAPLQSDLQALRGELAELKQQRARDTQNEKTRTAIDRTKNPVGAPSGGQPPAPVPPSSQLKEKTLPARSREWAAIR